MSQRHKTSWEAHFSCNTSHCSHFFAYSIDTQHVLSPQGSSYHSSSPVPLASTTNSILNVQSFFSSYLTSILASSFSYPQARCHISIAQQTHYSRTFEILSTSSLVIHSTQPLHYIQDTVKHARSLPPVCTFQVLPSHLRTNKRRPHTHTTLTHRRRTHPKSTARGIIHVYNLSNPATLQQSNT